MDNVDMDISDDEDAAKSNNNNSDRKEEDQDVNKSKNNSSKQPIQNGNGKDNNDDDDDDDEHKDDNDGDEANHNNKTTTRPKPKSKSKSKTKSKSKNGNLPVYSYIIPDNEDNLEKCWNAWGNYLRCGNWTDENVQGTSHKCSFCKVALPRPCAPVSKFNLWKLITKEWLTNKDDEGYCINCCLKMNDDINLKKVLRPIQHGLVLKVKGNKTAPKWITKSQYEQEVKQPSNAIM